MTTIIDSKPSGKEKFTVIIVGEKLGTRPARRSYVCGSMIGTN